MPHIIVKMYAGRPDELKRAYAEALKKTTVETLGVPGKAVSVAIEEYEKDSWEEAVVKPDIQGKKETVIIYPE